MRQPLVLKHPKTERKDTREVGNVHARLDRTRAKRYRMDLYGCKREF